MKTSLLRLVAVVGLSIGALALPTTALAGGGGGGLCSGPGPSGQVMNCHFSGLFAEAGYQTGSWDTGETFVSIYAMDGRALDAGTGAPVEQASASIFISKLPAATPYTKPIPTVELWGYVPLTTGFSIDKSLGAASLSSISIPVYGYDENGPVNGQVVTVNVSWTATGTATRSNFDYSYRSGGFLYKERFTSVVRSASAASSVAEGSTDWLAGLSPTFSDLQSTSDASLVVSRS